MYFDAEKRPQLSRRKTRVLRYRTFYERLRLNEIPNLINVLIGDMTLWDRGQKEVLH
jgi:lipopolysaccharide/colanic/teichoic acid biosynthesis glycosyltransferase